MFEVNLVSSDDEQPPFQTPVKRAEPVVVDLLSSSPLFVSSETKPTVVAPRLYSAPESPQLLHPEPALEQRSLPETVVLSPERPAEFQNFSLSSSPDHGPSKEPSPTVSPLRALDQNVPMAPLRGSQVVKRAFRSQSMAAVPGAKTASKKFKATKFNSVPAAMKLVTDRKKACSAIKCIVHETGTNWSQLIGDAFTAMEIQASCAPAARSLELEGISAIVSTLGEFADEWDSEHSIFVRTAAHMESLPTHIVVLEASYLDTLGQMSKQARDLYFQRVREFIRMNRQGGPSFEIVYSVPEVHLQFRKMMAAYDRRLRQRVMDHSNGRNVSVEAPPQQHYFSEVQIRLQVENGIRAVYPRTKDEAAETIVNWIIDMCFSRYRVRADMSLDGVGGTVKSKASAPEITAEALAVIHGLPPRIASSMAGDMKSIGHLRKSMGSNPKQQLSRLRYYGKGDWNESLIVMLTSDDSEQIIGKI